MLSIPLYKSAIAVLLTLSLSCAEGNKDTSGALNSSSANLTSTGKPETRNLSEAFKSYWYQGLAELTSYELKQARYGELRDGHAVIIFVTEDFLPEKQVKADNVSEKNIPVLKCNATKNFNTGIYPYSIMSSTFSPVTAEGHAVKVSHSVQEWCGHVYAQLNNRKKFEIDSHSYFENEADEILSLPKTWLENEIWNLIRINPEELPTGNIDIIPSFEFLRLRHKPMKAYPAIISLKQGDSLSIYEIEYPELERDLTIYFNTSFPFEIEKWEETFMSGFGSEALALTTSATKIKRIKTAYWAQNSNKDVILRDSLGLK
jgi:hypothetical protein